MAEHAGWVLDLVAAVEQYEDFHSKVEEGEECFARQLDAVPDEVRAMARGWALAHRALAAEQPEDGTR